VSNLVIDLTLKPS